MSASFSAIDLSQLPFPKVLDELSFEDIFTAMLNDMRSRDANYTNIVESDPVYKVLQVAAYREALLRQRINNAAQSMTLAYASGDNLDLLAANYNVSRYQLDAGDATAIPPIPATYEADNDLRRRALLAFEGLTTAGSRGSYIYHCLNATVDVKDASAQMIAPGQVDIAILDRQSDGSASPATLAAVKTAVNADYSRPLTDQTIIRSANINYYKIEAQLSLFPGPDSEVVRQTAINAAIDYTQENHRLGRDISLSGIYAALHQSGVRKVELLSPTVGISNDYGSASYCTAINVSAVSTDE